MTRAERLQWCKDRALEYLRNGDTANAYASFVSDAAKTFPEEEPVVDWSKRTPAILMTLGQMHAARRDVEQTRYWIEGFN